FVELCATKCGATSATRAGQSRSKWNTGLEAAGGKARPPCPLWVRNGHCSTSDQCPLFPRKRTSDHTLLHSHHVSSSAGMPIIRARGAKTYSVRCVTGGGRSRRICPDTWCSPNRRNYRDGTAPSHSLALQVRAQQSIPAPDTYSTQHDWASPS